MTERICPHTGKIGYESQSEASRAKVEITRRRKPTKNAIPLGVYLCHLCKRWHLGRKRRR